MPETATAEPEGAGHRRWLEGPPQRRISAAAVGLPGMLTATILIAVADIATGPSIVLVGLTAIPVLVLALTGSPPQVAALGVVATAITTASGSWNDNFGTAQYGVRLVLVVTAIIAAVIVSSGLRARDVALANERDALIESERLRRAAEVERARSEDTVRKIQAGLLPARLPGLRHWTIAADFRPGADGVDVGGDFYVVVTHADELVVMLGDVTGKGIEAAVIGTSIRHAARAMAYIGAPPEVVLRTLNDLLLLSGELTPVTLAGVWLLRRPDGRCLASIASAGHPLPYRIRPNGAVESLGEPGTLLGALPSSTCEWPLVTVAIQPLDMLFLFTDGVTEAGGPRLRFGEDRLQRLLMDAPRDPTGIIETIDTELGAFENVGRKDDVAMVALQYLG